MHCPPILPSGLLLDLQVFSHLIPPLILAQTIIIILQLRLTRLLRHEGRKMKQELRCHAVLCPKEEKARQMATCLQERLHQVTTSTNLVLNEDPVP